MSEALTACFNVSAPGPDHITWRYLKSILADSICASSILSLINSCITLRHWPRHFKESVSIIIPKPGKLAYDTPKAFWPIVLLNTLGKLIEKMIARRLQFDAVKHSVLHPNQLGGITQRTSSYSIVSDLMTSFGLVMEHDKSEIFHFSRVHNNSNPELDLLAIGAPILKPKTYW